MGGRGPDLPLSLGDRDMAERKTIVIDASALAPATGEVFNYNTFLNTYFQDLGSSTRTFFGATPGVTSGGVQAGYRYGASLVDGSNYVLMEALGGGETDNFGYSYRYGQHGAYDGTIDKINFGTYVEGTTNLPATSGGTTGLASGVAPGLVITDLDIDIARGDGTNLSTDLNDPGFNAVNALMTWIAGAGSTAGNVANIYAFLATYNQHFIGTTGDDIYVGTTGDDVIEGRGGNDVVDGGTGGDADKFVVDGKIADFEIVNNGASFSVIGEEWTATLTNIELVLFDDGEVNIATTPGNLALSKTSVAENAAVGAVVGLLSAVDPDGNSNALTYKLAKASDFFAISGNKLVVKKGADYETAKSHDIEVEVSDADGNKSIKTFTIDVTDVNEKPFDLKISKTKVKENVKVGTVVGKISASDVDAGDKVSYSLAAGSSKSFKIVGNNLVVAKELDYETLRNHSVTLVATDNGGLSTTRTVNIGVTDVVDVVVGTKGANKLYGGKGVDKISGGSGNDKLYGFGGNDTLRGGTGNDKISGGSGNDKLYGDSGSDTLYGSSGNDTVRGGSGTDKLFGGSGADKLYGDSGNDTLYGDSGRDTLYGGAGKDRLYGDRGADKLYGGSGDDKLYGGNGNDTLDGGTGNDVLYGESGSDSLTGGFGNDKLYGGSGSDLLKGGAGNDILKGESGADRLYGGNGADKLYGGSGSDTFIFLAAGESTVKASGRDTIYDFNGKAGDRIDLSGFDADSTVSGTQKFSFISDDDFSSKAGELAYRIDGGKTVIEADLDGDGKADFAVNLYGHHTLSQSDFLL